MTIEELLAEIKTASGPSQRLDAELTLLLTPARVPEASWRRDGNVWLSKTGNRIREPYPYTRSIDLAVELLKAIYPGAMWNAGDHDGFDHSTSAATIWLPHSVDALASTPALALVAAILRARLREAPKE